MKSIILLDRSWISRLALEYQRLPAAATSMLDGFNLIATESGGASALESALQKIARLEGRLYSVRREDVPTLDAAQSAALETKIRRLSLSPHVVMALRGYRTAAGRLAGDDDIATLGYVFRLLMIASSLDSAILTWEGRFDLFRAILSAADIETTVASNGRIRELRSTQTLFPLDANPSTQPRTIHVLAVLPPSPGQSRTYEAATGGGNVNSVSTDCVIEWDVFVSHASEDKDFVRELVEALETQGLRIWYDDAVLQVGDSLRRSIDRGLALSRFGIVVLSPSFFAKRWPQAELDGLFMREDAGAPIILPVWHEVDGAAVRQFSPMLAGRLGVSSAGGVQAVAAALLSVIRRGT